MCLKTQTQTFDLNDNIDCVYILDNSQVSVHIVDYQWKWLL